MNNEKLYVRKVSDTWYIGESAGLAFFGRTEQDVINSHASKMRKQYVESIRTRRRSQDGTEVHTERFHVHELCRSLKKLFTSAIQYDESF